MTLMVKANRRLRELYVLTVEHARVTAGVIPLAEGISREEAAHEMARLVRRDEALVEGSSIVEFGRPVYRLWKLEGSTAAEDVE